ncbi:hypothetical protein PQX77_013870 [Marasmius sp. AFHP31]|nr:hypothetical protein PQX77_013870 [Marasmius sp. AFHP31]
MPNHIGLFDFGPWLKNIEAINMQEMGGTADLIPESHLDAADPRGSWDTTIELNSKGGKDTTSAQNSLIPVVWVVCPRNKAKKRPKKLNVFENPFDSVFLNPEEV